MTDEQQPAHVLAPNVPKVRQEYTADRSRHRIVLTLGPRTWEGPWASQAQIARLDSFYATHGDYFQDELPRLFVPIEYPVEPPTIEESDAQPA